MQVNNAVTVVHGLERDVIVARLHKAVIFVVIPKERDVHVADIHNGVDGVSGMDCQCDRGCTVTIENVHILVGQRMDACCGLYDEYYWLYIELGYVGE